ncbi:MAG: pyridine nucleotide-disulfide oxidoreductase [Gammaproteobacteria bacterium]|nr:pyridine nucleotide-disulfide oxidoreductase [Gammaproteobacteria bacterium]
MNIKKIILLVIVASLIVLFFALDLQRSFNLEYFQEQRDAILAYKNENFWQSSAAYFFLYVLVAALSLPAAAILTIAGGAIFGLAWGLIMVSFASTIGATLAFLISRTLLRDWVQKKFGRSLRVINEGIEKDGVYYLFTLRMIPAFPFFLVNVVMALTPISAAAFYFVSQLGMLFGTVLYVNVGAELGAATSLPDVFNVGVIRAVVALAIFPWIARWAVNYFRFRKVMSKWKKPASFDTNMVVIGAGSAGLVTSYIAALVKARVTLVEKQKMGGDCLNTGCVPSKALLRSASVSHLFTRADEFGLVEASAKTDFKKVMARVRQAIAAIEPHDSVERYSQLGVDCLEGEARIVSPYKVEVSGNEISTRNIVIATGARPLVPDIPGIHDIQFMTSDSIWELEELPEKLLVAGGGPIGCELAQAFSRLGSSVTIVQKATHLLPREDQEVSEFVEASFRREDIKVLTTHELKSFHAENGEHHAIATHDGRETKLSFSHVLIALGRKANTENLGLKSLGIRLNPSGTIHVNEFLQATYPNIFACGDVAGPYQFTHMSSHQAWFAAINGLFGSFRKFRVNYNVVPWATFTDPEVGRVGLNEKEALLKDIPFEVTHYDINDLDRAIADSEARGFVKVLTVPGKDRILGATIVGYHAGELINEFILAMTHNLGLKKIMGTIHIYPTLSESGKFAAGEWRKKHAPQWLNSYLERFHRWKRS